MVKSFIAPIPKGETFLAFEPPCTREEAERNFCLRFGAQPRQTVVAPDSGWIFCGPVPTASGSLN